jgi:hypothetical protein
MLPTTQYVARTYKLYLSLQSKNKKVSPLALAADGGHVFSAKHLLQCDSSSRQQQNQSISFSPAQY